MKEMAEAKFPSIVAFAEAVEVSERLVFYWINGSRRPTPEKKREIVRLLGPEAKEHFVDEDYGAEPDSDTSDSVPEEAAGV